MAGAAHNGTRTGKRAPSGISKALARAQAAGSQARRGRSTPAPLPGALTDRRPELPMNPTKAPQMRRHADLLFLGLQSGTACSFVRRRARPGRRRRRGRPSAAAPAARARSAARERQGAGRWDDRECQGSVGSQGAGQARPASSAKRGGSCRRATQRERARARLAFGNTCAPPPSAEPRRPLGRAWLTCGATPPPGMTEALVSSASSASPLTPSWGVWWGGDVRVRACVCACLRACM
jgi:hypothetical protein